MATASVDNVKDGLQTVLDWANSQVQATCTYVSNNYMTCTDLASTYAGKAIESCDGLACVGSVTAVCDTYSNTRYTPDANGVLCFRIQGMTASFQNGVLTICSL